MKISAAEFLSSIEDQYIMWSGSEEKTKEIVTQAENIDVIIIFNKGRWIYSGNCPTPGVVENSINITSNDNDKVKMLFKNYLLKDGKCFSFPKHKDHVFEIRYFQSKSLINEKLAEEEKMFAHRESPRERSKNDCPIL